MNQQQCHGQSKLIDVHREQRLTIGSDPTDEQMRVAQIGKNAMLVVIERCQNNAHTQCIIVCCLWGYRPVTVPMLRLVCHQKRQQDANNRPSVDCAG